VPDAFSVVPILNMKIDRIERQAEDRKTSGRRSAASQEESPHATLHIVAKLKMFTISLNDDLVLHLTFTYLIEHILIYHP
jgi:hypothetical protein